MANPSPPEVSSDALVFGKYQVVRRLAVGGMGEIFLARQSGVAGFDRLVILKSLLPELAEQPGLVEEFIDEARVAATLNHPHIVSIYEVGAWRGVYFIAMEYIRGENVGRLQQAAEAAGIDFPLVVAVRVAHDAALGLDHAHHATDSEGNALGVVHRDVSPHNIMVRSDGLTKVVDFGIAQAANRWSRTRTGLVKGKLHYMSPEQAADKPLDGRSDQFSLGVVLWEMTTQKRLFKTDNELASLRKLLTDPIPRPSSVSPRCPPELDAVIMRMLERPPEKRYPRCEDAAQGLAKVLAQLDGGGAQGQKLAGDFVEKLLGDKLTEATKDVTPTKHTPFASLIGLAGLRSDLEPSAEAGAAPARPRRVGRIAAVVVLALAAVALGLGVSGELEGLLPRIPALENIVARRSPSPAAHDTVLDIRDPRGAKVLIDGVAWRERVPTVVAGLSAGRHEVLLELPGMPPLRRAMVLVVGEPTVVNEAPVAQGMVIDIRDFVGARVVVDDAAWPDSAPTVVRGLSPGAHELRLELPGKDPEVRHLVLEVGLPVLVQEQSPALRATLALSSTPDGATVKLGARTIGVTPAQLTTLQPDLQHTLVVEKRGYGPASLKVRLEPGELRREAVVLEPVAATPSRQVRGPPPIVLRVTAPAATPEPGGFLTLRTTPWVKVAIDGKPFGSTPLYKAELSPGTHTLHLVNEELGVDVKRTVKISSGKVSKLDLQVR